MTAKKTILNFSLALFVFLIGGCATLPPDVVRNADYGACPSDYESQVKNLMKPVLKDPYSAQYSFGTPYKAYFVDGLLGGNKRYFGYGVDVGVNAKNGFGGYTGEQMYKFFMCNDHIILLDSISESRFTKAEF